VEAVLASRAPGVRDQPEKVKKYVRPLGPLGPTPAGGTLHPEPAHGPAVRYRKQGWTGGVPGVEAVLASRVPRVRDQPEKVKRYVRPLAAKR
jgi:hypothetical protein